MPRAKTSPKLDTPTARARLPVASKPVYVQIGRGLHLGYRKNASGGRWVERRNTGPGAYQIEVLADADDSVKANGSSVLDFFQAQQLAQTRHSGLEPAARNPAAYTVRECLDDYLEWMDSHRKTAKEARAKVEALILPVMGERLASKLTASEIRTWHQKLAKQAPRLRSGKGKAARYASADFSDPEVVRQRRSTANRTLTILKAALNHSFQERRIADDREWRRVKPFEDVDAARTRYLADDEITKLLAASDGAFGQLIRAALHTGARYGDLCAARVRDFDSTSSTLLIPRGKGGKPRTLHLTNEGTKFFQRACEGKEREQHVFQREDGRPWGASHQIRRMEGASSAAKLAEQVCFHDLRHTYASHAAMNGMPLMVLARNLGHTDTRMVEKHYGHLSDAYSRTTIQNTALRFNSDGKV